MSLRVTPCARFSIQPTSAYSLNPRRRLRTSPELLCETARRCDGG
jgi:hypothetical protein